MIASSPPVTSPRLHGRRAIVTGGARGIGGEIAARLVAEGADVVVLDRLAEAGAAHAARIGARFVHADLSDAAEAIASTDEAIALLGGVDVLVNSAGILRLGALLDLDPLDWDRVIAVNSRATLLTMQAAARAMIAAGGGGAIVNVASMAAKHGGANEGAYAASKAAVLALTRAAALEWGCEGIRVNALCPGFVLTEMGADSRTAADVADWSTRSPLGRLGTPADVAAVAVFLASSDADYLTGQAINVTGGMIMH